MSQERVSSHTLTAAVLAALLAVGLMAGLPVPAHAAGTTYFISAAGSDTNSGTSSATPWRSLSKINATVLKPGDQVLYELGVNFLATAVGYREELDRPQLVTVGAQAVGHGSLVAGLT